MFDRAFMCGQERPTAKEWVEHLWYLLHNLKQCKQNRNHVYFTAKGCGLCAMEEKLVYQLNKVRKESEEPQKVRGMVLSAISAEEVARKKEEKAEESKKIRHLTWAGILVYLLFFGGLNYLLFPYQTKISSLGIGMQISFILVLIIGIYYFLKFLSQKSTYMQNRTLLNMMFVYAVFCLIIVFISLNHISSSIFMLTE